MNRRTCEACPASLPAHARADARYCSDACRLRARRARAAAAHPCSLADADARRRCAGAVSWRPEFARYICHAHTFSARDLFAPLLAEEVKTSAARGCSVCSADIEHRGPLARYCSRRCEGKAYRARRRRLTSGGPLCTPVTPAARAEPTSPTAEPSPQGSADARPNSVDRVPPPEPSGRDMRPPAGTSSPPSKVATLQPDRPTPRTPTPYPGLTPRTSTDRPTPRK
jgi:predicted nucleic acid-binding Zn ribbon protein